MKPFAGTLLALAVAASSSLPSPALYHCSVTGKRNQSSCCCAPRHARPACCESGLTVAVASVAPGFSRPHAPAILRGTCCSVTREPRGALLGRDAADSSWRGSLAGARDAGLALSAMLPGPCRAAISPARYRPFAAPHERAGPPLFILHSALLR